MEHVHACWPTDRHGKRFTWKYSLEPHKISQKLQWHGGILTWVDKVFLGDERRTSYSTFIPTISTVLYVSCSLPDILMHWADSLPHRV